MIRSDHALHLITDERLLPRTIFIRRIKEAVAAGARVVQLREKTTRPRDRLELAEELAVLLHRRQARLIINDDPLLAKLSGADGVHLGREDAPVEVARALLGPSAAIGVSCYGDVRRALEMEKRGASYVSFGACFPSPTKPEEPVVPLSLFEEAKRRLCIPIVAIGGIRPDNAGDVIAAGADGVAVVSAVLGAKKIARAVQDFQHAVGGKTP
ncbi:MAG: thiamine phosphate synthase [Elusimicrobia bacterium]|nr:thiamine phosphate synthase [Elusimicrobiota bacterium]